MNKKLNLQIVLMPIIFIIFSIGIITVYNISEMKKHEKEDIQRATQEYIEKHKKITYESVHFIDRSIKYRKEQLESVYKNSIKFKVNEAVDISNTIYEKIKDKYSDDEIKEILKATFSTAKFKNNNGYFFVVDLNTNKVIVNKMKKLIGKDMTNFKDVRGLEILKTQKELLKKEDGAFMKMYFVKPDVPNKEFEKLVYIKKIKQLNWMIGTGEYIVDIENRLQKKLLERFKAMNIKNKYIFIQKLFNIDGGKDFAKVILSTNRPNLVNKNISDDFVDIKGENIRKKYLKNLKKEGETYTTFWYNKSKSNTPKSTIAYMYHQKDWDWIIGSGFYHDDLEKKILTIKKKVQINTKEHINTAILIAIFLSIIISFISYILINRTTKTIAKYTADISNLNNDLIIKQNDLEKEKNKFQSLLDTTMEAIFISKDGKCIDVNKSAVDIFGFKSKEEMIDRNLFDYISDESKELVKENIQLDNIQPYEGVLLKKDKTKFPAYVRGYNINDKGIRISSVLDITYLRQLELQNKYVAMGEMIGNIAHQWRQPLNALGLTVQKIKLYYDEDVLTDEILDKSVEKSNMLIKKMSTTIDDFRNFFKTDKIKKEFNIKDAIENTFSLMESTLKYNDIKLDKSDIQQNIEYLGYKNELEQVLLNILNNAKDALVDNNIQNPKIDIKISVIKDDIYIHIQDNAGGIPQNIINKIFEPYFTTKDQGKGTGIGLYMSKMIIENNMDGALSVKNKNNGACFMVRLKNSIS